MKAKTLTAVIIVIFTILACGCSGQPANPLPAQPQHPGEQPANLTPEQPGSTAEQPIGSSTMLHSLVEHALSGGVSNPLVLSEDMYNGDAFRITHGGESLLDFGDSVRLHLFNDTATGDVSSHHDPRSPREVSMLLEYGGFTGEVVEKGARATFRTPGGANIYVGGTQFFVTYDPESGKTYVGNFKGSLGIESGGVLLVVMPGNYRKALPGEAPQAERPINLDMEGFEDRMRSELSPVKVSQGLDADIVIPTFVTQTNTPTPTPSLTPSPTPCVCPDKWVKIIVKPGDTLRELAHTYDSSVEGLMEANCLTDDQLVVGSELCVPYIPTPPPPPPPPPQRPPQRPPEPLPPPAPYPYY